VVLGFAELPRPNQVRIFDLGGEPELIVAGLDGDVEGQPVCLPGERLLRRGAGVPLLDDAVELRRALLRERLEPERTGERDLGALALLAVAGSAERGDAALLGCDRADRLVLAVAALAGAGGARASVRIPSSAGEERETEREGGEDPPPAHRQLHVTDPGATHWPLRHLYGEPQNGPFVPSQGPPSSESVTHVSLTQLDAMQFR
jgi:hypothetical protein